MKRKFLSIISLTLAATVIFTSCAPKVPETSETPATEVAEATATEATETGEKEKVKFYGLINEYPPVQAMVDRMIAELPQYDIEVIPVDWGNLDAVIKTGIASGDPCDIYTYWPHAMQSFVDSGQALDLTPYLEADSGAWKNTFVPAQLDVSKTADGKYYSVPLDATYQMAMVNVDMFNELGLTVNETWTWDEFVADCEVIKQGGYFPFALWRDGQDWFVKNSVASVLKSEDRYESWLSFDIAGDDPVLSQTLDRAKMLDEKGYWYPGEGGVNTARDEAKASFLRGETAILFEMASLYQPIADEATFEIAPVCWPNQGETVNVGGTDGYFIPSNAKNPEGAVECLKVLLDAESQAMLPSAGIIPSNKDVEITDPSLKKLSDMTQYMEARIIPNLEIETFFKQVFLADYVLGIRTKEEILAEYEMMRIDAKEAATTQN